MNRLGFLPAPLCTAPRSGIVQKSIQQSSDVFVIERCHHRAEFVPHRVRVLHRGGEKIPEIDLIVSHPAQLVNGELWPVVVELHQPFNFDEVVAFKRLDDLRHVVPHLAVDLTASIGKNKREVRLARAFLPHFFCLHQKNSGSNFFRFEFPDKRRFSSDVTGSCGVQTRWAPAVYRRLRCRRRAAVLIASAEVAVRNHM